MGVSEVEVWAEEHPRWTRTATNSRILASNIFFKLLECNMTPYEYLYVPGMEEMINFSLQPS